MSRVGLAGNWPGERGNLSEHRVGSQGFAGDRRPAPPRSCRGSLAAGAYRAGFDSESLWGAGTRPAGLCGPSWRRKHAPGHLFRVGQRGSVGCTRASFPVGRWNSKSQPFMSRRHLVVGNHAACSRPPSAHLRKVRRDPGPLQRQKSSLKPGPGTNTPGGRSTGFPALERAVRLGAAGR